MVLMGLIKLASAIRFWPVVTGGAWSRLHTRGAGSF